ncbi:hypothetical protein Esti_004980 [Eimeria stiedai]
MRSCNDYFAETPSGVILRRWVRVGADLRIPAGRPVLCGPAPLQLLAALTGPRPSRQPRDSASAAESGRIGAGAGNAKGASAGAGSVPIALFPLPHEAGDPGDDDAPTSTPTVLKDPNKRAFAVLGNRPNRPVAAVGETEQSLVNCSSLPTPSALPSYGGSTGQVAASQESGEDVVYMLVEGGLTGRGRRPKKTSPSQGV